MLSIYDNNTLAAALAQPIAPEIAALIRDRWDDAVALGMTDQSHLILIQAGDELAEIEQEIGFRPSVNPLDGIAYGKSGFVPYWAWLQDLGPAYELIQTVGTDFAFLLLIEKAEGVPRPLLCMCREYSQCV